MRRTNNEIRRIILRKLASGPRTINDLSNITQINWHTAERHINVLLNKKMVNEVLRASRVRIYEITQKGIREVVR